MACDEIDHLLNVKMTPSCGLIIQDEPRRDETEEQTEAKDFSKSIASKMGSSQPDPYSKQHYKPKLNRPSQSTDPSPGNKGIVS